MDEPTSSEVKILLDIHEAAALLGVKKTKAYEMAASGEMPGVVRIGRLVKVHRPTLIEWLAEEAAFQSRTGR